MGEMSFMVNQGSYDLRHDVDRLQNKVNVFENTFTDSYFIECSVPAIFYKDNTFSPKSITFYSYAENKGKITTYKGTIKISTSVDGTTYNTIKTSTDSNTTITISDTTIKYIKCQLYDTNNQLLDTQTVPVLKDGVDGTDGADGSSPISLFLGNESQLIPCTSEGIVELDTPFDIPFYCYKGTKMYPCTYEESTEFSDLGMVIVNVVQGTSTQNGHITVIAPEGEDLTGLKHSSISLNFTIDNETVVKEFNWAKIIKGANGDDGATPTLYVKYSEYEEPVSIEDCVDNEKAGYDYKGTCWVYDGVEPTDLDSYKPFVKYNAEDGTPAEKGYVHFAYANFDENGKISDFSTTDSTNRSWIGTLYDNVSKDSKLSGEYEWVLIKGENGVTPTTEDIQNVINDSKLDAVTLDGNSADSFIPAQIPVYTIYRDDSDPSQNYIEIYELGQLIICQLNKFNGTSSTYGQLDGDYFNLMPSNKTIPLKYRPQGTTSLYINDLATSTGESNGRLRLTPQGQIAKLGTAETGKYNNSYGTFIYPVLPRTNTKIVQEEAETYSFRSDYHVVIKDVNDNVLSNKAVKFTVDGNSYIYYSNSEGVATFPLPTAGTKTITAEFMGDKLYNPSSYSSSETINKVSLSYSYSGGYGSSSNYTLYGDTLRITVSAGGNPLPNWDVNVNSTIYTTDSAGTIYIKASTDTTYKAQVINASSCFNNPSSSISVTIGNNTTYNYTKTPKNVVGANTSGAIKCYDSNSLKVSRVQILDNDVDNSIICFHNSSTKASLRNTPAPIYFNCFGFPTSGKDCKVTATVLVGEFGNITGGSMAYPTVQILDVYTGTVYGTMTPDKSFSTSNCEKFDQIDVTATIPSTLIYSDNLAVKIIPKISNLTTTESYNKSNFRINYVRLVASS